MFLSVGLVHYAIGQRQNTNSLFNKFFSLFGCATPVDSSLRCRAIVNGSSFRSKAITDILAVFNQSASRAERFFPQLGLYLPNSVFSLGFVARGHNVRRCRQPSYFCRVATGADNQMLFNLLVQTLGRIKPTLKFVTKLTNAIKNFHVDMTKEIVSARYFSRISNRYSEFTSH